MPDFFHPQNNIFLYSFCMVFVDLGWSCGTVVIWFAQIWCGASMKVVVQSPFGFLDYTKYDQQESTNEVVTKSTKGERTYLSLLVSFNKHHPLGIHTEHNWLEVLPGGQQQIGSESGRTTTFTNVCAYTNTKSVYCMYIYIYTHIYIVHIFPFQNQCRYLSRL